MVVAKPLIDVVENEPLEPPPVIPRDEVATHLVDMPTDCSTIPKVPLAFTPSKNAPVKYWFPATVSV